MARILVTGGAGFIGSHLVHALLDRGDAVTVLDDLSTGRTQNLDAVRDRITFVEGSVGDAEAVKRALEGVDGVLHQAALPSVPVSIERPLDTHLANSFGTLNLLEHARHAGVKRIVYAASSSVYGNDDTPQKTEDITPQPLSPYAIQKLTGEYYCRVYHDLFGLETIGLRYFNVFGPRQDPTSQYSAVIPAFVTRMLAGQQPTVHGDGRQSRDFTYVGNVVQANFAALAAPAAACGRIYNAACGESTDLLQLIADINAALGTAIAPVHTPPRAGDVRHSCADITAAREALGYTPDVSFGDGMKLTVDWYRKQM